MDRECILKFHSLDDSTGTPEARGQVFIFSIEFIVMLYMPCNKYIYVRYVEANIRISSECRKYNTDLPKWVHNKPIYFSKYCIEKMNLAQDIKKENIKFVESIEG